jgi:hypothetical protein
MKVRVIRDDCGNPYLVRLSLFELFGFALKLHVILRSDRDRELHDHPWTFVTWMICGGYWEYTPTNPQWPALAQQRSWVKPGALRVCRAPYPHRLELINPAVTLVLMFPKFREWGFYKSTGWVPWTAYQSDQEC